MSKDEMNDLQEVRPEDPALERILYRIREEYQRAQLRPEILKPKAYALHKVWREVERSEVPKVRKRQDKGE